MTDFEFTDFVNKHISFVKRVALKRLGGNHTLADDIMQETFLSLWKRKDKFEIRDIQTAKALLCRVVQRRIADYFRDKKNHEYPIDMQNINIQHLPIPSGFGYLIQQQLITTDATKHYSLKPYSKEVEGALNALPFNMRSCVILVLSEGYTHQEVANRLNIPLGTVLSRVSRGKRHLRKFLTRNKI